MLIFCQAVHKKKILKTYLVFDIVINYYCLDYITVLIGMTNKSAKIIITALCKINSDFSFLAPVFYS